MKYKLIRRRMSISAPKMTVRRHIPWPIRVGVALLILVCAVGIAFWIYQAGKRFAGFGVDLKEEVVSLKQQVEQLTAERDHLLTVSNAAESNMNIERAASDQMARQIRSLDLENGKLKEDIAFFENLSSSVPVNGLAIKRLALDADAVPQQWNYRMLVTQGGKIDHDFSGDLQLLVTVQQDGKTAMIRLPADPSSADAKPFQVTFRFYKRLEGTFQLPAGAVPKQLEARILERGAIRAQQTVMVN